MCLFCSRMAHGAINLGRGTCRRCVVARSWQAMVEFETWESLAKKPGGDHDTPFVWGNWRGCLTPIQQGRCVIMRGFVRDVGQAPPSIRNRLRFGGDSEYIDLTPTGLYVASLCEPEES